MQKSEDDTKLRVITLGLLTVVLEVFIFVKVLGNMDGSISETGTFRPKSHTLIGSVGAEVFAVLQLASDVVCSRSC